MIHDLEQARKLWKHSLFVAVGLATWAGAPNAAGATAEDAYTWSAELVDFDEASRIVTVKARVVNHEGIEGLSDFSGGDRVMLTWSGIFTASGIRAITPGTESEFDRFTMPVEFVAAEMDGQYVTFRLPIPGEDTAKIAALTPGTWVTATTPHQPSGWAEAVTGIRAFTDVS